MKPHTTLSRYNDRNTRIDSGTVVHFSDCTLREGEQSAIVNFIPEQKLRLAHKLAEAGIHQVQVGYSGLSTSDFGIMRQLRADGIGCDLEGVVLSYIDSWDEQLRKTAESGATHVIIVHVPSPPRRERVFRVTPDQIAERCHESVHLAKELGLFVTYCPADTTRTELDLVLRFVAVAEAAGADRISIADTLGAATPGAVRFLIEQVRGATELPLAFHNHNDFGLALANALAALEAGAEVIDTTLNGWGDRTGNPATEELAALLHFLYGAASDVDVLAIANLAREMSGALGVPTPPTKPITGAMSFAHKLETHVLAVQSYPPAFEPFDPVLVGGTRQIAIGQYSGPNAIRFRLQSLGLAVDADALGHVTDVVRSRARATNRVLTDDDLKDIVTSLGPP